MKKLLLPLLLMLSPVLIAAGGQMRIQNPVVPEDGCVFLVPEGLDPDHCASIPADYVALSMYLCSVTVVCDIDRTEPGRMGRSYLWSD